jgi:hypothetical protein
MLGYNITVRRGTAGWNGFLQKDGGALIQVVNDEPNLSVGERKSVRTSFGNPHALTISKGQ